MIIRILDLGWLDSHVLIRILDLLDGHVLIGILNLGGWIAMTSIEEYQQPFQDKKKLEKKAWHLKEGPEECQPPR